MGPEGESRERQRAERASLGDDLSDAVLDAPLCFMNYLKNNNRKQVVVLSTLQVDTPREGPNQGCVISRALERAVSSE